MIMLTRPLTAGQEIIQSALRQQTAHPTGHIGGGGHIIVGFWILNAERAQQRIACLLYTSPSPRDGLLSRMPSSA